MANLQFRYVRQLRSSVKEMLAHLKIETYAKQAASFSFHGIFFDCVFFSFQAGLGSFISCWVEIFSFEAEVIHVITLVV